MGRQQFTALVRVDEGACNYEKMSSSAPVPDTFLYNGSGKIISITITVTHAVSVSITIDGVAVMAETWNFSTTLYTLSRYASSLAITILGAGPAAEKLVLSYTKES